jgi:hypothetical protein
VVGTDGDPLATVVLRAQRLRHDGGASRSRGLVSSRVMAQGVSLDEANRTVALSLALPMANDKNSPAMADALRARTRSVFPCFSCSLLPSFLGRGASHNKATPAGLLIPSLSAYIAGNGSALAELWPWRARLVHRLARGVSQARETWHLRALPVACACACVERNGALGWRLGPLVEGGNGGGHGGSRTAGGGGWSSPLGVGRSGWRCSVELGQCRVAAVPCRALSSEKKKAVASSSAPVALAPPRPLLPIKWHSADRP